MPAKTVIALALTATASAGIAAGATLAFAEDRDRIAVSAVRATETPTPTPTDSVSPSGSASPAVAADQAMTKALEKAPGLVAGADMETEGDTKAWKVDVLTKDDKWREVVVDAQSGEVTEDKESSDDSDAEEAKALRAAKVTAADAVTKATEQQAGTVESVEFNDDDSSTPMWEVTIKGDDGSEKEIHVSADTGEASPSPTSS